jgi:hypothetical protein
MDGGWHSDERTHKIDCHVKDGQSWSVTFREHRTNTAVGPWVLLDSAEEVLRLLTWGNISHADLEQHHCNLKRWGVGGGLLHLTTKQYHQLRARRVGWPWNGYELQKMKEAGTYPPKPMTVKQEEEFLEKRRKS